eukprot:TRINITY_DN9140_c0_g1_i1.p1 TRINITY_DN9140_c0_g1~~TRINITY_DN9140_c0_g1_i1.p1  ORF type:complete len:127 (+),score=23.40 TRINITY_DN9140_c0_g1_i1:30-383(+)
MADQTVQVKLNGSSAKIHVNDVSHNHLMKIFGRHLPQDYILIEQETGTAFFSENGVYEGVNEGSTYNISVLKKSGGKSNKSESKLSLIDMNRMDINCVPHSTYGDGIMVITHGHASW